MENVFHITATSHVISGGGARFCVLYCDHLFVRADSGGSYRGLKAATVFDGEDFGWKELSANLHTDMISRGPVGGKCHLKWAETSREREPRYCKCAEILLITLLADLVVCVQGGRSTVPRARRSL